MSHPLNFLWPEAAFERGPDEPPIYVYEITTRTLNGEHLWAPDDNELVELMWGVIGRSLSICPTVELYGVHVLSTHYGMLAGVPDQATLERFKRHLNSNLARETNQRRDRSGPVVGRRARSILVDTPEKLLDRMGYQFLNGVKENLVSRPDLWPGVHCAKWLLEGKSPRGKWINRGPYFKAKLKAASKGKTVKLKDFTVHYDIGFVQLPSLRHLPPAEYRAQMRKLSDAAVAERVRLHGNKAPLGVKILTKPGAWRERTPLKVRRPKEGSRTPDKDEKSDAPPIHCAVPARRKAFKSAYNDFVKLMRAERVKLAKTFAEAIDGECAPYRVSNVQPVIGAA